MAQEVLCYDFNNSFFESHSLSAPLIPLGKIGRFVSDSLPELNRLPKTAYAFDINCGLNFDNKSAQNFIKESYTIELYFKFDKLNSWKRVIDFKNRTSDKGAYIYNGKLNFYKFIVSDVAPAEDGAYTHYVISRDYKTKQLKVYADGISKIDFIDKENHAVLDSSNQLHFFQDDLSVQGEASAGMVAMMKIYNRVLSPDTILYNFAQLETRMIEAAKSRAIPDNKQFLLKGKLLDASTGKALQGTLVMIDENHKTIGKTISNAEGVYDVHVPYADKYLLEAHAPGYLSIQHHFELAGREEMRKDILLNPIKIGATITLKNLQFERGQYELLPQSFGDLDALTAMLKENPNMQILIKGHTDNQGDALLNVALSQARVDAVRSYLVQKGIDKKRIGGKGFGGAKPIASNKTEELRKLNRRVEFTVVKN